MARDTWHMQREDGAVTLSRRVPACWDVAVEAELPDGSMGRIAHQVRQDLWRALQRLRGFSPAVRVEANGDGLLVTAGGAVAGAVPPGTCRKIREVLDDPANRARWVLNARKARS